MYQQSEQGHNNHSSNYPASNGPYTHNPNGTYTFLPVQNNSLPPLYMVPQEQPTAYYIVHPQDPTLLLQQENSRLQQQVNTASRELHFARQEIQRLNQVLSNYHTNITTLTQEEYAVKRQNISLMQERTNLMQENIALKLQMTNTQPVSYNEDANELSILSSTISTMVERPGVFENLVLSLPSLSPDLKTPVDLPPLRLRLEDEFNSSEYFQQFIPYIQEEIRAGIVGQIEKISQQQLRPFTASFDPEKKSAAGEFALSLNCRTQNLPKLDHAFQQEAVWVVIKKQNPTSLNKWDRQEPLHGFLAIASAIPKKNQSTETLESREVAFSLLMLNDQYEHNAQYWQNNEYTLEIHWLHGLIPAARDYQACISSDKIFLESQIIRGNLPTWPQNTQENMLVASSPFASADEVIDSLKQVQNGIYCLQGPPGTGKTSTTVNLLKQWTEHNPDERILICAPSNQAVQVVFERAQFPDVCIALLINSKAISEINSDAIVNHFASRLYHPLQELLNSKDLSASNLKTQIAMEYESIFDKLHELNRHKRKAFVKVPVQKKIEELEAYFFEKMRTLNQEETSFELPDLLKNLEDSIEHLKNNAHFLEFFLIQRAQIVFATLTGSGRDFLKNQIPHFQRVIIDEACQATIPTSLIPLVRFNPNILILVGDHKQLPATLVSKHAEKMRYSTSLFSALVEGKHQSPYKMLTTQFRMHPKIALFSSQQYYSSALETDPSIFDRPPLFPRHKKTIFHTPTLFFNIRGKEIKQGHSYINDKEAEAIVATTIYLLRCGIRSGQIGIITFYAAQASRIIEHLRAILRTFPPELTVSTVDSFQGGERDFIMVSSVRTKKDIGFVADPNRFNVCETRGRHNFCLFANENAIKQSNNDLAKFAEYATVVQEKELLAEINAPTR